jgi:F420-dependent oxidoreductase-like protein
MDFRVFVEPQLQGATYTQQVRAAQVAEDLGFNGFFRSDHYLTDGFGWGQPGPTDSWLSLAGIARETHTIRIGTLVTAATLRLPGPLAIEVAQVDEMSNGRVELGLGTGWHEGEHRAFGIPFPVKRFGMLAEQLQIVKGLWSTPAGATFDFDGAKYKLTGASGLQTVQQPHPPIIVGGRGRVRTPELAARYADEFNIGMVKPETATKHFGLVREKCEELKRSSNDLTYSVALVICCGTSTQETLARANRMERGIAELRATALTGTPAEVVDKIGRYSEGGAERIYLQFLDMMDFDHMELVAHQVMSQLT